MGEPGADRLDLARVFALADRQHHAAGHQHARAGRGSGQGHHHRRQALVAGGHAQHAPGVGDRAGQAAEDRGRVVAIGQAVEHAGRALGAAVARVGAMAGVGHAAAAADLLGGRREGQAQFPVARVIAQGDGRAVVARRPPRVLSSTYCGPARPAGSQPMPASCDMPNASPLGRRRSCSSLSGRLPCGPGPWVTTSYSVSVDESNSSYAACLSMAGSLGGNLYCTRKRAAQQRIIKRAMCLTVLAIIV